MVQLFLIVKKQFGTVAVLVLKFMSNRLFIMLSYFIKSCFNINIFYKIAYLSLSYDAYFVIQEVEDDDLERAMAASISSIRSHEILSRLNDDLSEMKSEVSVKVFKICN